MLQLGFSDRTSTPLLPHCLYAGSPNWPIVTQRRARPLRIARPTTTRLRFDAERLSILRNRASLYLNALLIQRGTYLRIAQWMALVLCGDKVFDHLLDFER